MEENQTLASLLRTFLADDRALLARSDALIARIRQHPLPGFRALKERRSLERALQETAVGELLLNADGGTARMRDEAADAALAALRAINMQDTPAVRTIEILTEALGWDAPESQTLPPAAPQQDAIDADTLRKELLETLQAQMQQQMQFTQQWMDARVAQQVQMQKQMAAMQDDICKLQTLCEQQAQQQQPMSAMQNDIRNLQAICRQLGEAHTNRATQLQTVQDSIRELSGRIQQLHDQLNTQQHALWDFQKAVVAHSQPPQPQPVSCLQVTPIPQSVKQDRSCGPDAKNAKEEAMYGAFIADYNAERAKRPLRQASSPSINDHEHVRLYFRKKYGLSGCVRTNSAASPPALRESAFITARFWVFPLPDDSGRSAVVPSFRDDVVRCFDRDVFDANEAPDEWKNITILRPAIFSSAMKLERKGLLELS